MRDKRITGRKCTVEGCNRLTSSKGVVNGIRYYKKYCSVHSAQNRKFRSCIDISKCSICGWVGPCDTHRITFGSNGGHYTKDNVVGICPNCHRLIHSKLLCLVQTTKVPAKDKKIERLLFELS